MVTAESRAHDLMLSATVIVPTYNRPDALARTLDALLATTFPSELFDVVVIDTGRQELGAEAVARARGVRYEKHPDLGVSAARNRGAATATGDILLFVDDDTVVDDENLRRHVAAHREDERCMVCGHRDFDPTVRHDLEASPLGRFRLSYEDRYNEPDGVGTNDQRGRVYPLTLAAYDLSIRREAFALVGGFDEQFPVGAEDRDLTWRARRMGYALKYDYDIRVVHNDQHRDLMALCRRLERAAVGTVYFAKKNPDAPQPVMLSLNGPVQRGDSTRLIIRKVTRSLLSQSFSLVLAHNFVRFAERLMPEGGPILEWLYNALGGLYVFRGVRRGLQMTSEAPWPPAHQRLLDRV